MLHVESGDWRREGPLRLSVYGNEDPRDRDGYGSRGNDGLRWSAQRTRICRSCCGARPGDGGKVSPTGSFAFYYSISISFSECYDSGTRTEARARAHDYFLAELLG